MKHVFIRVFAFLALVGACFWVINGIGLVFGWYVAKPMDGVVLALAGVYFGLDFLYSVLTGRFK